MVRVAHLSDTHLGYRQYNIEEREQDIYDILDEIAEKIIEERVDIVIHTGDLFDIPKPEARAYYEFKRFLNKLGDKTRVITILGDHDTPKKRGLPPHFLFDDRIKIIGVSGLEHLTIDIDGEEVLIAGISNLKRRYRGVLLEELKAASKLVEGHKKSILMLHQAIDKFLGFEEAFELTLSELPEGFRYYAMGHLHNRIKEEYGDGVLAYAGSIEIIRRDEIRSWRRRGKGFYLVDIDDRGVNVEGVDVENIRPQIEVEFRYENLERAVASFTNSLPTYPKAPIIHPKIYGEGIEIDRQYVHEVLNKFFKNKALSVRMEIVETAVEEMREIQHGTFNINTILREYFDDEEVAEFSIELFKLLKRDEIKEAKKIADEFLRRR
ncbi:MAG: metallophosphoesterase [Candidatus Methanospirareceae archaeon]